MYFLFDFIIPQAEEYSQSASDVKPSFPQPGGPPSDAPGGSGPPAPPTYGDGPRPRGPNDSYINRIMDQKKLEEVVLLALASLPLPLSRRKRLI